jgi:hypothetical protein
MKLDNRKNVYRIWLGKFLATVILTFLIITIGFTEIFQYPVLGIDKSWYMGFVIAFYICLAGYVFLLRQNYVSYSDNGEKIILRYYPIRILNQKKNSIEIPKQSFSSWEIKKFMFGRCEMLYVSGKFKNGIAKYPGISLSALNAADRNKIKAALSLYVKKRTDLN